ncbi:threonine/homoserine/homoserine lactone efflux protein [Bradyrhizobium embrapense]
MKLRSDIGYDATRKLLNQKGKRSTSSSLAPIERGCSLFSDSVNAMIALAAGSIAVFLGTRPTWLLVQRWLMGTVLAGLAMKMALEAQRT